jgi:hypothetical protein
VRSIFWPQAAIIKWFMDIPFSLSGLPRWATVLAGSGRETTSLVVLRSNAEANLMEFAFQEWIKWKGNHEHPPREKG